MPETLKPKFVFDRGRQTLLNSLVQRTLYDLSTTPVIIDSYIETAIASAFSYPKISTELEGLDIDDLVTVLAQNYNGEDEQNRQKLSALARNLLPGTVEVRYLYETYHENDYNKIFETLFSSLKTSLESKQKVATFKFPPVLKEVLPPKFFNPVRDFVLYEMRNFNAFYGEPFKNNPDSVSDFYVPAFISEKKDHSIINEIDSEQLIDTMTQLRRSGKMTDQMVSQLSVIGAAMFPLTKNGRSLEPEQLKEAVNQMVDIVSKS